MNISETLRQLADDMENRPNEKCWLFRNAYEETELTAEEALALAYTFKRIRRKPKTSRERFEEWRSQNEEDYKSIALVLWEAWQEAESQAKEGER